ncbi:kinase-like protein [Eremomyces bilateralis CBS 781.70]|uniref:Kinase-like protein n=1 Tax=Eremomyces bilateralis CBS 781.70 TaxID=1392243 RepID=A0A6G1FSE6_9PEZI|nr:kinase-like protein [Eremomyces bilateralis CBS 781.70]KAF1808785.1 kinase-like protein [Eremomyces bilateralis CBS 781.70]
MPLRSSSSRPNLRPTFSASSFADSASPGSSLSSPALNAMTDITPLPSPLVGEEGAGSPNPWRRASATMTMSGSRPGSRGSASAIVPGTEATAASMETTHPAPSSSTHANSKNLPFPTRSSPSRKKKGYQSLMPTTVETHGTPTVARREASPGHSRSRSVSDYVPEPLHNSRPRNVTISSSSIDASQGALQREAYLADKRGFTSAPAPAPTLPTPPPSNRSVTESDGEEPALQEAEPAGETFTIHAGPQRKPITYRPIRPLGQGTFSKVVLATSEAAADVRARRERAGPTAVSPRAPEEPGYDPGRLVALKIVAHGPAGGADEERVELGLKREVEILKSIRHPSLVNLRAFDLERGDKQALLVLEYCPGGDLFELASKNLEVFTGGVARRIFAELVGAVRYLHSKWIVHRDIKLENILLNYPASFISHLPSPTSHPYPLITLTDLGLSRSIPSPPHSPFLTTRCGSEDYAAPEILLGQPYDGRATDAWAAGVVLYTLIEGRLPFDPPAGGKSRGRSKAAHRIARCEWGWWRFGDEDGNWVERGEGAEEGQWRGARRVVGALLKKASRGRLSLDEVAVMEWVHGGIDVKGGLTREYIGEEEMMEGRAGEVRLMGELGELESPTLKDEDEDMQDPDR